LLRNGHTIKDLVLSRQKIARRIFSVTAGILKTVTILIQET
jgi:hypothetical protein